MEAPGPLIQRSGGRRPGPSSVLGPRIPSVFLLASLRPYARGVTWTPYADLDALLAELLVKWEQILGENLVAAYVQGSFALGAGDQFSDCDWIVALNDR